METPNDSTTIQEVRADLSSWKGKLVAFRVRVVQVYADSKGQPIMKVEVGSPQSTESFWVASLLKSKFVEGDDVVFLGLMTRRPDRVPGSVMPDVVTDPFVVMGFCFVNLTEKWGAGDKLMRPTCDEWFKERMPTGIRRK